VDDEEEFDDWIDQLHGFVHIIQPIGVRKSRKFAGAHILSLDEVENEQAMEEIQEEGISRSTAVEKEDDRIEKVKCWHQTLERPQGFSDMEYVSFMTYVMGFFLDGDRLWRKDSHGTHQLFIPKERRIMVLKELHDNVGHRHFYTTCAVLTQRFWWLHISCHICQVQQMTKVLFLPVVATPAPLFAKEYMDTMHMPVSGRYKNIVQGRYSSQSLGCCGERWQKCWENGSLRRYCVDGEH
jgi:Integrase zinc binding domain